MEASARRLAVLHRAPSHRNLRTQTNTTSCSGIDLNYVRALSSLRRVCSTLYSRTTHRFSARRDASGRRKYDCAKAARPGPAVGQTEGSAGPSIRAALTGSPAPLCLPKSESLPAFAPSNGATVLTLRVRANVSAIQNHSALILSSSLTLRPSGRKGLAPVTCQVCSKFCSSSRVTPSPSAFRARESSLLFPCVHRCARQPCRS